MKMNRKVKVVVLKQRNQLQYKNFTSSVCYRQLYPRFNAQPVMVIQLHARLRHVCSQSDSLIGLEA
jgi:hypothetical protein